MSKNHFTAEQNDALEAKGNIIVAASAGSGKTTVMIEKIVRLILSGVDVSEILAVTFTKKAAQQMKDKLKSALIKAINNEETKREDLPRLKKQLAAAQNAEFSTIHAFCGNLIRTHFYAAGTSSDFSIIDAEGMDGKELQQRALATLFEKAYESGDKDFSELLSVYFRKKKDDTLKKAITEAYETLREKDNYHDYLEKATIYDEEHFDNICAAYLEIFKKRSAVYRRMAERGLEYFERANAGDNMKKSIDNATALIGAFVDLEQTNNLFDLKNLPKDTFKSSQKKSDKLSAEFNGHIDALKACKDEFNSMHKAFEALPEKAQAYTDYLSAGENAKRLKKYILAFEKEYDEEKRQKNVLDYNDLQHIALALLAEKSVQEEMREKYPYIFVDEYQDVNPVQERLISLLGGENVFLVGDVKQAIYGFRGSKSEYFVKKKNDFFALESAFSLAMNSNFRSAPVILEAVNDIFSAAMTNATSSVDYKDEGMMKSGGERYKKDGRVQFHVVKEKEGAGKKPSALGVYSVRAFYHGIADKKYVAAEEQKAVGEKIAALIQDEVKNTWFDADDGTEKPITYGDIAILMRTKRQVATQGIVNALIHYDIPFTSASPLILDDYPEIKMATDILSYIDNVAQDIPMCSALLSPAWNFTCDELATIRLAYNGEEFFRDACKKYADKEKDDLAKRLRDFFASFDRWRTLAAIESAAEVLTQIISDTGLEAGLLSRRTGKESLKRLHYFISISTTPEPLSVHEFLAKLRLMKGKIEYFESAGENVVQIMTMHASKGLEYPVVILGDCCAGFGGSGDREEVRFDDEFGIATNFYDTKNMIKRPTLQKTLIGEKKAIAERKDELNIFYVALTRAKFSLHLIFSADGVPFNPFYAKKYAEFIPPLVFDKYRVEETEETAETAEAANDNEAEDDTDEIENDGKTHRITRAGVLSAPRSAVYDEALSGEILTELTRKYKHSGGENLPVKQSATLVISEIEEAFGEMPKLISVEFSDEGGGRKSGESKEDAQTRRLTGLAYHAFLQYADFAFLHAGGDVTAELVEKERARLCGGGELSAEYNALLSTETLTQILRHKAFAEFAEPKEHTEILREANFLVALPVKDVYYFDEKRYGSIGEETTLFQGAIDLLLIGEGYAHIVDYKYSRRDEKSLKERYATQLTLYKKSVAKITGIAEKNIRCTLLNLRLGYATDFENQAESCRE